MGEEGVCVKKWYRFKAFLSTFLSFHHRLRLSSPISSREYAGEYAGMENRAGG